MRLTILSMLVFKGNDFVRSVILVLFMFCWSVPYAGEKSKHDTIVLPLNDWASQRVLTKVVAKKIEQLGYKVEFVEIGSINQWGALRKGIIHLQIEVWQSTPDGAFAIAVRKGFIEDLGEHSAQGREDWWYPIYAEKKCAGLPDWRALNRCASLFSHSSNGKKPGKGVFYTGPWNYRDADLIRALKLDFTIERLKNAEEIWEKLQLAKKDNRPVLLLNWTPNWIDARIEGRFVEFPAFTQECETDPSWGINKSLLYDCANPKVTLIKKAAWPNLKKQWPCIYQLIKKIDFSNEMISEASALRVADGLSEEQAVEAWLKKYAYQNLQWLNYECKGEAS